MKLPIRVHVHWHSAEHWQHPITAPGSASGCRVRVWPTGSHTLSQQKPEGLLQVRQTVARHHLEHRSETLTLRRARQGRVGARTQRTSSAWRCVAAWAGAALQRRLPPPRSRAAAVRRTAPSQLGRQRPAGPLGEAACQGGRSPGALQQQLEGQEAWQRR